MGNFWFVWILLLIWMKIAQNTSENVDLFNQRFPLGQGAPLGSDWSFMFENAKSEVPSMTMTIALIKRICSSNLLK